MAQGATDQPKFNYTGDLPDPRNDNRNGKKNGAAYFPSTMVDPAIKSSFAYCLQTVKAIYYRSWSAWNSPFGNLDRNRMIDNQAFGKGNFDVQAFMGGKNPENSTDQNPILKNLDFDPVTELSKTVDVIVSYLEQVRFSVSATTINPAGAAQKENIRLNELANISLRPFSGRVNKLAGTEVMPRPQFPFRTADELNIYFQLGGFKLAAELQIELGNQVVMNDSNWHMINKNLCEDALYNGRIAVDTEVDENGKLRYIWVDTVNCGVEDYRGHLLDSPSKIWYTTLMTVQQVLMDAERCGQPFTYEQAIELAKKYENKYNNPSWSAAEGVARNYVSTDSTLGFFWYQWKIPVMKTYWEEVDVYRTATITRGGKEIKMPTNYNDKSRTYYDNSKSGRPPELRKREVKTLYIHNYYQGKWIPGTDFMWDYGTVPYQVRDPYNIQRALCPLKYYRIGIQPMMERIKGLAKKEYIATLKLDQEISNAKPFGWMINVAALENISLGQGKTLTVEDVIVTWNQSGNLLMRDEAVADEYGRTKGKVPLVPIQQQGVLEAVERWIRLINYYRERIVQMTGINEFMDASNPNANTSATAAKAAIQGSKNSMGQIVSALRTMVRELAIDTSARMQYIVKEKGGYDGYADSMGAGLGTMMRIGPEILGYKMGIMVDAMPNEEERKEMKQAVYQAFASMASPEQGGLWVDSMLLFNEMIDHGTNMKIVRLLMQARQKEMLEFIQQQKQQLIQEQSQANAQAQQGAAQQQLQQEQAMSQMRMQEDEAKANQQIRINQSLINEKTIGKIVTDSHKSGLKLQEQEAATEAL